MDQVKNLSELCSKLQVECEGKTISESFELLQSIIGNNIRIRYEAVKADQNTPSSAVENKKQGRFGHLNDLNVTRVLLTSERLHADFSHELARQCNGVVLEYPTWRILSVPAAMFNPKFRFADLAADVENYTIYDIKDGTTVTLYWYDNKWRLSSANGFDVGAYYWMGQSTYLEALNHVAKQYPDFSFDKLKTDMCYTIGFRHNEFHHLRTDPPKMWLIQTCDLAAINGADRKLILDTTTNIGIPLQTTTSIPPGMRGRALIKWIQDKNAAAYTRYINSTRSRASSPEIHYGFVLRSKISRADIILESELLKQIRTHMYNLPKTALKGVAFRAQDRLEYTILRAYISYNARSKFINLFPQFRQHYDRYSKLFETILNRVISALRNRNSREVAFNTRAGKTKNIDNIDKIVTTLVKSIESRGKVNMGPQSVNIVQDFIMDKQHLDLYYSCIIGAI